MEEGPLQEQRQEGKTENGMRIKTSGVTGKALAEKHQHFRWTLLDTGKSGMERRKKSERRKLLLLFPGNCKEQGGTLARICGEICGIFPGNPGSKSNTGLT